MSRTLVRPLNLTAIVLLALALVAAQGISLASAGGNGTRWAAPLSGSMEVPTNDSKGTGVATFKLSKDRESVSYKLNVANIENVTQSHIHLAPEGTNGPVVAFLFGFVTGGVTENGRLAEGTITAADLRGPLSGMTISDLVDEMNAGNIYVNVHTVQLPPGEIRGQLK